MNAPVAAAAIAPVDQVLAVASITPSATHIQELRRARFDKKLLAELAESIKVVGVLQPIVARPFGQGKYEIVAGERRWLAAKLAGMTEIRASVADLNDEQVLEVQLIENLQREGLHELEEAEGYEELMKLKKISADAVADMVGRSRSYVFKRTKLLALCPEARKAFYTGELDASTALLIARIPHQDLQQQALKDLMEQREYGGVQNFKDAQRFFHDNFMLQLKAAPFKLDDANLVAKAGPCTTCPKRTGNQKDLFGDVKSGDVCTDPKCFAEKRNAGEVNLLAEYKTKGVDVIVGDAAKRVLPYSDTSASGGYHLAGGECWEDPKHRKYSELVDEKDIKLVQSPHTGKMVKVVHNSALPAKKKAGTSRRAKPAGASGEAVDARILELAHKSKREPFNDLADARALVWQLLESADAGSGLSEMGEQLEKLWGWKEGTLTRWRQADKLPKPVADLTLQDLLRFAFELVIVEGLGYRGSVTEALAKRSIDRKKVEKQVAAEAKAAKTAAPEKKGTK